MYIWGDSLSPHFRFLFGFIVFFVNFHAGSVRSATYLPSSIFHLPSSNFQLPTSNFQLPTSIPLCPWEESNPHLILRRDAFYPLNYRDAFFERATGFEPATSPWEGDMLPLHHARSFDFNYHRLFSFFLITLLSCFLFPKTFFFSSL